MNIFSIYLNKIKKILIDQNKKGFLKLPENLNSINIDVPPKQFDFDISTNVSMVLSKVNLLKKSYLYINIFFYRYI